MKAAQTLALFVLGIATLPALATTFRLDADGQEALYKTPLPKAVYQHSRSEHLNDLTILNAGGEQVPYALLPYEELHPLHTTKHDTKPLTVYPIHESQLKDPGELSVKFEQMKENSVNTTVNLNINTEIKDAKSIYLIDAGDKHPALQTLSVEWKGSEDSLTPLDILASDDLKNWSQAGHAVLLKTSANGQILLQNRISLDHPTEARYLQIRPAEDNLLVLTKINAEYSDIEQVAPNLLWQELQFLTREQNNKTGEINLDFESPGRYPVSRLHITLPETNTITNVRILARKSGNDPWQYLSTASLYHMVKQGKTYASPDVIVYPTAARYWRLQFDQTNGGLGHQNAGLSAGWLPHTVIWNARGTAPFALQIGKNPDIINRVAVSSLIHDYDTEPELKSKKIQQIRHASLVIEASMVAQSDNPVENTWQSPPDYKRWLLWGGLFLGVLLLAGMAYSLVTSKQQK